jgi:uncharacterized protein
VSEFVNRPLLIVGASGRAAAQSACRVGWQPFVIDLFADEDTRAFSSVWQCPLADYPHGFIALAVQAPPGPWMYTGGLENYPDVVEAISRERELFGVGPDALEKVRNPFFLQTLVPMPAMFRAGDSLDAGRQWLSKPSRSSGGLGIEALRVAALASGLDEYYAQEWFDAPSYSALFLFNKNRSPSLIGVCAQLIGESWLHAPAFQYCGNIGPIPIGDDLKLRLQHIGNALQPVGLQGLVGIDFLWANDVFFVLEVNPRYTASVELYERASGESLLGTHIQAFQTSPPNPLSEAKRGDKKIHGKAVLYAKHSFVVPQLHPWRGRGFADIPTVGSTISEGQPVVTLFASGDTETECRERLMELARVSEPR